MIEQHPDSTLRSRERRPPRRRKRRNLRPLLGAAVLVFVFAFGLALGWAIHDNPKPSGLLTTDSTVQVTMTPLPHP